MNNFTFGDDNITYYETIAGGAGAGPGWVGRSGVHTHMTNTRITDPEILERRYPVVLHDFSLRKGSGGAGKYRGGDGVVREASAQLKSAVILGTTAVDSRDTVSRRASHFYSILHSQEFPAALRSTYVHTRSVCA